MIKSMPPSESGPKPLSRHIDGVNMEHIYTVVDRPEWILGGEEGANKERHDFADDEVLVALMSPTYYPEFEGTPGATILYNALNLLPFVHVERCYFPEPKLERYLKKTGIPLFTLESKLPLHRFDIVGFSIFNTLQYFNLLPTLDMGMIPTRKEDRVLYKDPLLIGGGCCTVNPEPLAEFFDVIFVGEGEEWFPEVCRIYHEAKAGRWDRKTLLKEIAKLRGSYVPEFYEVSYDDANGKIVRKALEGAPEKVVRRICDLQTQPAELVAPCIHGRSVESDYYGTVEIARGCPWTCRFCSIISFYAPYRERPPDIVKKIIDHRIDKEGATAIGLSSPNPTAYSHLNEIVDYIISRGAQFRIQSERADTFSDDSARANVMSGRRWVTIALESPDDRIRRGISKVLPRDVFLNACDIAFKNKFTRLKIVSMLGHPHETPDDARRGWEEMLRDVFAKRDKRGKDTSILLLICPFRPKPWTPFQWAKLVEGDAIFDGANMGIELARRTPEGARSVRTQFTGSDNSRWIDTYLSRGDTRVSKVIRHFHETEWWVSHFPMGGLPGDAVEKIKAYSDYLRIPWRKYIEGAGVDEDLPWDFIDVGQTKEHMRSEWEKSKAFIDRPPCFEKCVNCGACSPAFLGNVSRTVKKPPRFKFNHTKFLPWYARLGDLKVTLRITAYVNPIPTCVTDYRRMIERALFKLGVGAVLRGIFITQAFFRDGLNHEGLAIIEASAFVKKEWLSKSLSEKVSLLQPRFTEYGLGEVINVEVRTKSSLVNEIEGAEFVVVMPESFTEARFNEVMNSDNWRVRRPKSFSSDKDRRKEEDPSVTDVRAYASDVRFDPKTHQLRFYLKRDGAVSEVVALFLGIDVKSALKYKPILTHFRTSAVPSTADLTKPSVPP